MHTTAMPAFVSFALAMQQESHCEREREREAIK